MYAVITACLSLCAPVSQAAGYPERPITLVVPWPPGGLTDNLGRMMAQKLTKRLATSVIVENRPGASGLIGAEYVMRAAPDGYTLVVTSSDSTVKMLQAPDADPATLFTPVAMLASVPVALAVGPKFKGSTLKDYVDAAKRNPGAISYASLGEGGATNYGMESFAKQASMRLMHIPYKGTAPAVTDVLSGQVDSTLLSVQTLRPYFQSGRLHGLAATGRARSAAVPDLPTFAEQGYPDFDMSLWYGINGPKGMPDDVVRKLNEAIRASLAEPDFQKMLNEAAAETLSGSPQDMDKFIKTQVVRWKEMMK
jgi:tripartite-type tricarboxylate transporter receptor subunit TctC